MLPVALHNAAVLIGDTGFKPTHVSIDEVSHHERPCLGLEFGHAMAAPQQSEWY